MSAKTKDFLNAAAFAAGFLGFWGGVWLLLSLG